ncbi:MAG: hypothetical protein J0I33_13835 [Microbacterium ginsengisoli]|uniref:hypothetical protein n=1 Tax=Microbacterium TaxID=33882 RepID=UPI0006F7DD26|nr:MULTISPECIES: hypothetical protein [unclassified Microbacterium]KQR90993.1 hypothetical protein ASF93_08740 [Microbacterium sp. Leaf347]KQS00009.1 hypothetical protein ASG00_10980 [Microbacterium sp. Leaf351]MBN9199711.1 hypothetical protein [Microbacterium ginsengisoli]OJU75238.1 MAG: hypothetical protein BGO15_04215 [Microbacterium sp. 71-23]
MTAHQSSGRPTEAGRAVIVCDGCAARFTRRHVSVNATRAAAEKAGWLVGTRDNRRDYCTNCREAK